MQVQLCAQTHLPGDVLLARVVLSNPDKGMAHSPDVPPACSRPRAPRRSEREEGHHRVVLRRRRRTGGQRVGKVHGRNAPQSARISRTFLQGARKGSTLLLLGAGVARM